MDHPVCCRSSTLCGREQRNLATAHLDGSQVRARLSWSLDHVPWWCYLHVDLAQVYGEEPGQQRLLREWRGGRLREEPGGWLLRDNHTVPCSAKVRQHTCLGTLGILETLFGKLVSFQTGHCFFSGDKRTNVLPGLTLYHTLWHRWLQGMTHLYQGA